MDCFGTDITPDDVRLQSATEWTASVQTSHIMYKAVIAFASKHTFRMTKRVITVETLLQR